MKSNRSGRPYDREFKNNAVALVRGGRTITEVARDLGVSKWSLGHSVRRAAELGLERPEQRELRRLRQELEYVSRQRDIFISELVSFSCCADGRYRQRTTWSSSGSTPNSSL